MVCSYKETSTKNDHATKTTKEEHERKTDRLFTYGQYTDFHQVRFSIQGNSKHYNGIHRHWVWKKKKIQSQEFHTLKIYVYDQIKGKKKISELQEQYEVLQTKKKKVNSWDLTLA